MKVSMKNIVFTSAGVTSIIVFIGSLVLNLISQSSLFMMILKITAATLIGFIAGLLFGIIGFKILEETINRDEPKEKVNEQ